MMRFGPQSVFLSQNIPKFITIFWEMWYTIRKIIDVVSIFLQMCVTFSKNCDKLSICWEKNASPSWKTELVVSRKLSMYVMPISPNRNRDTNCDITRRLAFAHIRRQLEAEASIGNSAEFGQPTPIQWLHGMSWLKLHSSAERMESVGNWWHRVIHSSSKWVCSFFSFRYVLDAVTESLLRVGDTCNARALGASDRFIANGVGINYPREICSEFCRFSLINSCWRPPSKS